MAPPKPQFRVRIRREVQQLAHIRANKRNAQRLGQLGQYIEDLIIEDAKEHLGEEFVMNYLEEGDNAA